MSVSPARRAAYEVLLRVFEHEAYADRVFRSAAADLDERDRAFAHRLAYGAVQRVRTLDYAIETLGKRPVREARSAGAGGAPARRVSARVHGDRAARRRERVGRARPPRPSRARGAVHERDHAAPRRRHPAAARRTSRRPAEGVLSRLDLRRLGARPRRRRRARADADDERAARDGRPARQRRPAGRRRADRPPRRVPGRAGRRPRRRRRTDLAAEPRLAARRARRRLAGRRARARPLRRAGRKDDAAPRCR